MCKEANNLKIIKKKLFYLFNIIQSYFAYVFSDPNLNMSWVA